MVKPVILDSSALIALIYKEKGAEVVQCHLVQSVISTVNLTEVASFMVRKDTAMEDIILLLRDLSLDIVAYDEAQALLAAQLLPKTVSKGLSLGDRACLALALTRKLPVLTADKVWKTLEVGVKVEVIR